MRKLRTMRSMGELKGVSNHLRYEVNMLLSSATGLASGVFGEKNTVANALLEAFVLHLRTIMDFLYPRGRRVKDDDVLASDFFDSAVQWCKIRDKQVGKELRRSLENARDRADKEMAHLTYSRLKVTSAEKGWPYIKIANEVRKAIRVFIDNVPKEKLSTDWLKGPKQLEGC
jgi:hypothetical protein